MPLPEGYRIRLMEERDYPEIEALCARVYPEERPYTDEELKTHHHVFPEGQLVAEHLPSGKLAGAHFTLILSLSDFHLDDSWEVITAKGLFTDHDPVTGYTLYGADLMVHPDHQHHGLAHVLTDATREIVRRKGLWRMAGASRMPGYAQHLSMDPKIYIQEVKKGQLIDPVLTAHLHDGWEVVMPIRGYLPHDVESAGWAAVIQWLNANCPVPPGFDLEHLSRRQDAAGGVNDKSVETAKGFVS